MNNQLSMFSLRLIEVKGRAILARVSDVDRRPLRVFKSVVDCGGIDISTGGKHVNDLETAWI